MAEVASGSAEPGRSEGSALAAPAVVPSGMPEPPANAISMSNRSIEDECPPDEDTVPLD